MSDMKRRDVVCGHHMLPALHGTRGCRPGSRDSCLASNLLSLMCISQYPLQNTDLSGLWIERALLYESSFDGANLTHTTFFDCDLNRAQFHYANVTDTTFTKCGFGALIMPPLTGHRGGVTSVAFSPDGKYIVSGSWDDTFRVWDASSGDAVQTSRKR
eukprot:PhF_6_TR31488/c1_g1_i1/m.46314